MRGTYNNWIGAYIIASEYGNQLALWACNCPVTLILLPSSGNDETSNFRRGFGLNEVGFTVSAVFVVITAIIVLGLVVIIKRIRFVIIIIASVIKVWDAPESPTQRAYIPYRK